MIIGKKRAELHVITPKYFLDSSTFIHTVDETAQFHEECLAVITKACKGEIQAATSLETLEETLYVLSKIKGNSVAIAAVSDFLKMSRIKKIELNLSLFEQALEIIETTPLKGPKDAINVATMLENKIPFIISEDKDYDKVGLIQRIHPKELAKQPDKR